MTDEEDQAPDHDDIEPPARPSSYETTIVHGHVFVDVRDIAVDIEKAFADIPDAQTDEVITGLFLSPLAQVNQSLLMLARSRPEFADALGPLGTKMFVTASRQVGEERSG